MRRLLALTVAVLALAVTAAAPASASPARLTHNQMVRAVLAYARPDHPRHVTFSCHRTAPTWAWCSVDELGMQSSITDNGQPIVGDLSYTVHVRRTGPSVRVSAPGFVGTLTVSA